MTWNYLKIAIRNLLKHRLYSSINLLGLSIGLAIVLLIMLYLQVECSYDNWHPNEDQLYRIAIQTYRGEVQEEESHIFTPPIGPDMKAEFPEVKAYTRFSTPQPAYLSREGKALQVAGIHYADTSFGQP